MSRQQLVRKGNPNYDVEKAFEYTLPPVLKYPSLRKRTIDSLTKVLKTEGGSTERTDWSSHRRGDRRREERY